MIKFGEFSVPLVLPYINDSLLLFFCREIESHQELKQEPFFEEQKQSTINQSESKIENIALEEITSNDVILNNFSESVSDEAETSVSNENKIEMNEPEVKQTDPQNPELYLTEGDIQNTSEEHKTDDISNPQVINIESEHSEEMTTNTETIADNTTNNIEESPIKEAPIAKESVVDGNVQDIIDGSQEEPMEIEEIPSTDVVTENKSSEAMEDQVNTFEHCYYFEQS